MISEYDVFKEREEEYINLMRDFKNYRMKQLKKLIDHFDIDCVDNVSKEIKLSDEWILIHRLTGLCIFKLHEPKTLPTSNLENKQTKFKIFHRIKDVKFDKSKGKYYLIVDKYCNPLQEVNVFDYTRYIKYDLDESEFNNEYIKKLKIIYEYEDSIKKRKKIKEEIDGLINVCRHKYEDGVCKKCFDTL